VEPIRFTYDEIGIIDRHLERLVAIKQTQEGLDYRAALLACARDNPGFFAARERLLSGQSAEELFLWEEGQLVAVDLPEAPPRRCGPYEELFFGLVAEKVDSTRIPPQEARRIVARENPTVFRRYLQEVGIDAPPASGVPAPMARFGR